MSAFMVEDKTINRVVTWISDSDNAPRFARDLAKIGIDIEHGGWAELGKAFYALNRRGVDARYGPGESYEFRPDEYQYKREHATPEQVYMSAQCLRYQCAEGNLPETDPLYKFLDQVVIPYLAHDVIKRLRAYQEAEWG